MNAVQRTQVQSNMYGKSSLHQDCWCELMGRGVSGAWFSDSPKVLAFGLPPICIARARRLRVAPFFLLQL